MNMPRLTRSIFADLLIYMLFFGLLMGLVFPLVMPILGVASDSVQNLTFFFASIVAGMMMGLINFFWVNVTVRPHLRLLADRMQGIESVLKHTIKQESWSTACSNRTCFIEEGSEDEIGASAQSFNALLRALVKSHDMEVTLKELSNTLSSSLELSEMGEAALRMMVARTNSSAGCLFIEDKGGLALVANLGIKDAHLLAKDPFVLYSVDIGRKDTVSLPEDVEVNALLTSFRPKEMLVIPILYKEQSQGVLVLASADGYSEDDHVLLNLFGQGLGLAMSNAQTHDRLQDLASMDPLTEIYNRRFGLNRLREEFQRAQRGQLPLALAMIDLDHFKIINDKFGHLMGDRVLIEVSKLVRNALRDEDILVRYGGEELLMVLPGADLKMGVSIADRIRHLIAALELKDDSGNLLPITASMGVSAIPRAFTENELQLIKAADDALYQAKAAGRNRVLSTR
ncbi:MAG: GGDEF domain-containing protein [Proteobacteria bacterium]|nr:GGDEF domain-containing protein [Pseudomonadota bacterium]